MFGIFNMRTDVDACAQGLYKHCKRVCAESWLWEKNPLLHQGAEPVSVLHPAFHSNTVPTELCQCLMKKKHKKNFGTNNATFMQKYYLLLLWHQLCVEGHSLLMVWQSMVPILHRSMSAEWMAKYEKLTDMVVPRSSRWVHDVLCFCRKKTTGLMLGLVNPFIDKVLLKNDE